MSPFPRNHCKGASFALAHFLKDHFDLDEIKYVWGWLEHQSHGWITVDGVIVDITADQFDFEDRQVIVSNLIKSNFHQAISGSEAFGIDLPNDHNFLIASRECSKIFFEEKNI